MHQCKVKMHLKIHGSYDEVCKDHTIPLYLSCSFFHQEWAEIHLPWWMENHQARHFGRSSIFDALETTCDSSLTQALWCLNLLAGWLRNNLAWLHGSTFLQLSLLHVEILDSTYIVSYFSSPSDAHLIMPVILWSFFSDSTSWFLFLLHPYLHKSVLLKSFMHFVTLFSRCVWFLCFSSCCCSNFRNHQTALLNCTQDELWFINWSSESWHYSIWMLCT